MVDVAREASLRLPVGPIGRHGLGSWGVGTLIATEAALFCYLLFSYYYTAAVNGPNWVLDATPPLKLALPNTIVLLLSSVGAWLGERGVLRRRRGLALFGFALALVLGIIFFVVQLFEWHAKPFHLGTSSYASLYYVTTGFHMAHVGVGLLILAALFGWTLLDYFSPRRNLSVTAGVLYWLFVDVVWLFVFATYYLSPYLGFGT
jgi:heme/copper-type cytochrome/quinol oxidase subunit 3